MKVHTVLATCFLPELVAELAGGDPFERVIIFCEDKFTLSVEMALAKRYGGTFNTNVFTFNRYLKRVLPSNEKVLSQEGCTLVVKRVLMQLQGQLVCFKKTNDPNLASAVYELIAQLKSAKITPNDIKKVALSSTGNLKRKLNDIGLIFEGYEKFICENGLTDGNNRLHRLPEALAGDTELKGARVIIAGFPSLNKTLCEIFKSIVKNAAETTFAVVTGDNKNLYTSETFYFATKQFDCEVVAHSAPEAQKNLLGGLYNLSREKYPLDEGKIFYFCERNCEQEISRIAKFIAEEVRGGARYGQFAICAERIEPYELLIKRIFGDYGLPLFIDVNKNLGKHPLTRLVCDFIDVANRNFDVDCVFRLVKNPLFTPDRVLAEAFEQYCVKYAINRKSIRSPFSYEDENLDRLEEIRLKLVETASSVSRGTTFGVFADRVNKMLERIGVGEGFERLSKQLDEINSRELGSYNDRAKGRFEEVMDEAISLLGEQKLTLLEIKNIILSGMTACKIPLIPEYNDCVFVGDFRAIKYGRYHTLFAVGLSDGVPSSKLDTALLCDRDIDVMNKSDLIVEPKIKEVNRRSRENACMALASFTDRLILSYSQILEDGKRVECSEIINYVKERVRGEFGSSAKSAYLTERTATASFIRDTNEFKEGKTRDFDLASAYYKLMQEVGRAQKLEQFLKNANEEVGYLKEGVRYIDNKMSATAIEGYFNCPYSNFLSRGLRVKEVAENHIMANDLGTMVHSVAEEFLRHITKEGAKEDKMRAPDGIERIKYSFEEADARRLAEECFEKVVKDQAYSRYTKSAGGKRAFELIKKECVRFCLEMFLGAKNSAFKPEMIEARFGGRGQPPICINTKHGQMDVIGVVDRLDSFDRMMRIVDYKTGYVKAKEIEEMLYTGKKLQLFLYAKAFEDKYKPAGVYYMPVADEFSKEGEDEKMNLKGRTLADDEIIRQLDYTIDEQNTKGSFIDVNVKRNKNGEYSKTDKLLSVDEFGEYLNYAKAVAGKGLEEMAEGVIFTSPYEEACSYCKYHGICGYDEAVDGRTRKANEVDKDTILSALFVDRLSEEQNLSEKQDASTDDEGNFNEGGGK